MKRIGIQVEDELFKELKIYAINSDQTVTDIIIALIRKELETKKEQSR